jgi:hypothetical protein
MARAPGKQPRKRSFGQLTVMRSGRYRPATPARDGYLHTAHSTFEDRETAMIWLRNERRLIEDAPERWIPPKARARRGSAPEASTVARTTPRRIIMTLAFTSNRERSVDSHE